MDKTIDGFSITTLPPLINIYSCTEPRPLLQSVVRVHVRFVFSERRLSEIQRQAAHRLRKSMKRGSIVKIDIHRWVMVTN